MPAPSDPDDRRRRRLIELGLDVVITRSLARDGLDVQDLREMTDRQLLHVDEIGPARVAAIRAALARQPGPPTSA